MAAATISEDGKNGLIKASQALALVALELLENPDKLKQVKEEFNNAHKSIKS